MSVFSKVGGYKPSKTAFNLSHSNTVDMGFGQLVPVDCLEVLPGDVFTIDTNVVGRLSSSLDSPILADMDIILESFFVPCRLLMGSDANFDTPVGERRFEEFLVGGKDGNESLLVPSIHGNSNFAIKFSFGGIGDFLGVQPDVAFNGFMQSPIAFPWRAYRFIWNEFYRVEGLMEPIQVCQFLGDGSSSDTTVISLSDYDSLLYRSWRRDYFTSSLPYQQFGTAPAFQLEGVLPVDFDSNFFVLNSPEVSASSPVPVSGEILYDPGQISSSVYGRLIVSGFNSDTIDETVPLSSLYGLADFSRLNASVDLNKAITFDMSDIRTNMQIQKWMERNARGGVRYTEYLQSHFGVSPHDSRLQRPEFIGAFRLPWLVSEVLQTSASQDGSFQGNQAGQAIVVGKGFLGKYRCYEFGYIMVLASIVPKPQYQQGLPRMFSRRSKLDWYSPEFAHLSEQAVLNKEIFVSGDVEKDNGIFGFQGIWNELRFLPSRVSNHMRSNAPNYSFDYWHMARIFADTPVLNKEFLQVGATEESRKELMRVFPVQDENPFIVDFGFNIKAVRPLPYIAEPGWIDHF